MWWILPDGEQLAWPRAKIERLEWHVEVDFVTEVSLLEGHVASSRLTSTRRSRISKGPAFLLALSCRIGKSGCETCSWRARVGKKRQGPGPGMMRGPVWRGPQAAGKRHSQPFSAKRLPHPRGVCRPTKPVATFTRRRLSMDTSVRSPQVQRRVVTGCASNRGSGPSLCTRTARGEARRALRRALLF